MPVQYGESAAESSAFSGPWSAPPHGLAARAVADGTDVLAFTYEGCDGRTRHLLHVGANGTLSRRDRFVERTPEPGCVGGAPPGGVAPVGGRPMRLAGRVLRAFGCARSRVRAGLLAVGARATEARRAALPRSSSCGCRPEKRLGPPNEFIGHVFRGTSTRHRTSFRGGPAHDAVAHTPRFRVEIGFMRDRSSESSAGSRGGTRRSAC
jgi:hypothetical protein